MFSLLALLIRALLPQRACGEWYKVDGFELVKCTSRRPCPECSR